MDTISLKYFELTTHQMTNFSRSISITSAAVASSDTAVNDPRTRSDEKKLKINVV